jgi:cellobiose phosphorylase
MCLDSALSLLDSDVGLQLHTPPYAKKDTDLGRITYFAAGTKENAAVFCHAVGFMIAALCQTGRGNDAYEALSKIMPSNKPQDRYVAEPYVFAEYITGPSHPTRAGQGQFSWITGTAAWIYVIATQWIAGIRPDYAGLRIDPCVPSNWKKLRITRPFRGALYDVEILNPDGVEHGVAGIELDGRTFEGTILPVHGDGKTHRLVVTMGETD